MRTALLLVAAGSLASASLAQTGVRYRLDAESGVVETFCLPPCACPFHQMAGSAAGVFTLTLVQVGPLFTDYRVDAVSWTASLPFVAQRFAGSGTYRIGGEVALAHQLVIELSEDGGKPVRYDSGLVPVDPLVPFPGLRIGVESEQFGCRMNEFRITAHPVLCYADCDSSGQLTVADFACFLNGFAAGDPYANCDGSTNPPVLNVADFACFLNRFGGGCS